MNFVNESVFFKVELFFQENQIEILDIMIDKDKEEMFETMRIYVERAGRAFNYFKEFEKDIHINREKYLQKKVNKIEMEKNQEFKKTDTEKNIQEEEYWQKMQARIKKNKRR